MAKLLSLILISLVWCFIGWFAHDIFTPTAGRISNLPAEEQRMLRAHQLLQSRQLLLNRTTTASTSEQLTEAAVAGMLTWSRDRYATLYGPRATAYIQNNNDNGMGISDLWFDIVNGEYVVTEVPTDSPGALAGIQVGDILLRIDDFDVSQSGGGYEVALLLRGPVDSTYQLTFQRGDRVMTRTVTRQRWNYLSHQIIDGDIGYLKTEYFSTGSMETKLQETMEEFAQAEIQALIWDLCDNAGGTPAAAETVLNYFCKPGTLLYTVEFKDGTQRKFTANGDAEFAELPIVVLINKQTWSAGEIAAAAMAERATTVLMGSITAGKGVIQDTVALDQTHLLEFTIAKWFTPTGEWVHEKGVNPDIDMVDNPTTAQDEVLIAAIDSINGVGMKIE